MGLIRKATGAHELVFTSSWERKKLRIASFTIRSEGGEDAVATGPRRALTEGDGWSDRVRVMVRVDTGLALVPRSPR